MGQARRHNCIETYRNGTLRQHGTMRVDVFFVRVAVKCKQERETGSREAMTAVLTPNLKVRVQHFTPYFMAVKNGLCKRLHYVFNLDKEVIRIWCRSLHAAELPCRVNN